MKRFNGEAEIVMHLLLLNDEKVKANYSRTEQPTTLKQ